MYIWFLIWVVTVFAINEEQKAFFDENGYLGPLSFLSLDEAEAICEELNSARQYLPGRQPGFWSKNILFNVPKVIELGQREELLCFLQQLLGPDILLWGAELMKKPPGVHHRWHVDIEHTGWDGLTIWLPLRHVSLQSTILFIPGSHHYDFIPQNFEDKIDLKNDEEVLRVAHSKYPDAKIVSMEMQPGQFVLFAGRTWHHSVNHSTNTRHALILQYCRPDAHVRIPLNYRIPTMWAEDQPWVLKIAGEDRYGINHLYPF